MSASLKWIGRHPFVMAFAVAGLLLAGMAAWNVTRPNEDERVRAIRGAGYPVTLAELNKWYSPVPADQNAALWYEKGFATPLCADPAILNNLIPENDLIPPRGQPMSSEVRDKLVSLFAKNQETFRVLCEATNCYGSRYQIDMTQGFNTLLPHLSRQKQAVALLTTKALLHCSLGETRECAPLFLAATRLSDSLSTEPLLISQLVRIACWALVAKRLELALNLEPFLEADLSVLQDEFVQAATQNGIQRGLVGERVCGLSIFIDPRMQNAMFSSPNQLGIMPSGLAGRAFFSALKVSGVMQRDKAFFLDAMATNIAILDLPLSERLNATQQVSLVPTNRFLIFSRLLLPSLGRAVERDVEHSLRMRVTVTALAVERFRTAHGGSVPKTLEELVPGFLSKVPTDIDGQPLRFASLPAGFVVYSVGADGRDDGGTERNPKKTRGTGSDLTFIIGR